jgi:hypothetical protein
LKTRTELQGDEAASRVLANVYLVCYIKFSKEVVGTDGKAKFDWKFYPALIGNAASAYPCDVVERKTAETPANLADNGSNNTVDSTTYTVVLKRGDKDLVRVEGMPRAAIRFGDQRYTSDLFLPTAFRHAIDIPVVGLTYYLYDVVIYVVLYSSIYIISSSRKS